MDVLKDSKEVVQDPVSAIHVLLQHGKIIGIEGAVALKFQVLKPRCSPNLGEVSW